MEVKEEKIRETIIGELLNQFDHQLNTLRDINNRVYTASYKLRDNRVDEGEQLKERVYDESLVDQLTRRINDLAAYNKQLEISVVNIEHVI